MERCFAIQYIRAHKGIKLKVLVLGLGLNGGGRAAAVYFAVAGHDVRISDIGERERFGDAPAELEALGIKCCFSDTDPRNNIVWADVVIKNPAVPQSLPQLSLAKVLATDFSYLFSSEYIKNIRIIAVTGTKGKTTTVAAITHALNAMGHEALFCGNIGVSAFTVLNELSRREKDGRPMPEFIVCELSSWQIHDAWIALNGEFPPFALTIFTSLYADHQNSYSSMNAYVEDKLHLFTSSSERILVLSQIYQYFLKHTRALKKKTKVFPSLYNPYKEEKLELQCAYDALKLLGFNKKAIVMALNTYKGMPHRIEQVALKNDIMYINDSAATIPEAVTFSMKNIAPLSVHLICGGTDKRLKASGMEKAMKSATSITLLDGSFTRGKLIPMLEKDGIPYTGPYASMEAAFNDALAKAEVKRLEMGKLQVILLSPGAASFELFRNEFDRGDQFKQLVLKVTS